MNKKTCFKCGEVKPLDQFNKHPMMADGHLNKCNACSKKYSREQYQKLKRNPKWLIQERGRHRVKSAKARKIGKVTTYSTDVSTEVTRRYRGKYPEKYKAHEILTRAIKNETLIPQNCFCGEKGQGHHPDYSKPLEVIWLCQKHHREEHVKINESKLRSEIPD